MSQTVAERTALLVLGVDTCGSSGSVALARIVGETAEILAQKDLAGRTYSATLVATVSEVLEGAGVKLRDLGAIVIANGPGSFTGVRVGLSAVKGLAEPGQIPVVAVSRLEVMAAKARVKTAALDAHRHEVFLRVLGEGGCASERLAGAEELAALRKDLSPIPKSKGSGAPEVRFSEESIAVCEEAAEAMLKQAWPEADLVKTVPPTAADAIELCISRILAQDFADLALLDGHYLRRSDAEIFGEKASNETGSGGREICVRAMRAKDLNLVIEIASRTPGAPGWPREAYEKTLDSAAQPRRVALVAECVREGALAGFVVASLIPPQAELETIVTRISHQRSGVARDLFSSLKNELRRMGAREVILEVRAGNKSAQGLYRFLGFQEQGRRGAYYADPVEDAILMGLQLA